jgi:hypothetical protein
MNSSTSKELNFPFESKIALILSIIYIFINIFYKKLEIIMLFVIILICYCGISFYLDKDTILSKIPIMVSFSILISFIFSLLFSTPYQENFASKKKIKKKIKDDKEHFDVNTSKDDDENDNFTGNNHIDLGTSFLEAYKNLDKNQINAMTKDTKELIKTQKTLMDTLQNLSPVVKEGKAIIDTFKGYFDKEDKK